MDGQFTFLKANKKRTWVENLLRGSVTSTDAKHAVTPAINPATLDAGLCLCKTRVRTQKNGRRRKSKEKNKEETNHHTEDTSAVSSS